MMSEVEIVALPEFMAQARERLTDNEFKAARQLLAANPYIGKPVTGYPGVLSLEWNRAGLEILYSVALEKNKPSVLLLTLVMPNDLVGDINPQAKTENRKYLSTLKKYGVRATAGYAIKEFLEWLLG